MFALVDRIGHQVAQNLNYTYELFLLSYLSFRSTLTSEFQGWRTLFGVISAQIYFTGWQAMPLISFLAFGSGALVALQAIMQMTFLGGVNYVGTFMVMVVVRELGPLLTALIVIARSGTAVASELGSMKVNKEVDALKAMGINPLSYIIFPRLLGGIISVICLAFYFIMFATFSGFLVCRFVKGLPFDLYFSSLSQAAGMSDFFIFFIKNFMSGLIIFSVSCYQGLQVDKSPHEIPQVTTKAVVKSTVYVLMFNMLLTLYFYFEYITTMGMI
ncbi:MAG: ABC transporter permease [Bdellovibrionales bacterium]|nr:ABC transporter permease [Bdellovibrionales bacterium]